MGIYNRPVAVLKMRINLHRLRRGFLLQRQIPQFKDTGMEHDVASVTLAGQRLCISHSNIKNVTVVIENPAALPHLHHQPEFDQP